MREFYYKLLNLIFKWITPIHILKFVNYIIGILQVCAKFPIYDHAEFKIAVDHWTFYDQIWSYLLGLFCTSYPMNGQISLQMAKYQFHLVCHHLSN